MGRANKKFGSVASLIYFLLKYISFSLFLLLSCEGIVPVKVLSAFSVEFSCGGFLVASKRFIYQVETFFSCPIMIFQLSIY